MKKYLFIGLLFLLASVLCACQPGYPSSDSAPDESESDRVSQNSASSLPSSPKSGIESVISEEHREIVTKGGYLKNSLIDLPSTGDEYSFTGDEYPESYIGVDPSTGYTSIKDVRSAMSQYCTDEYIDQYINSGFVEHDGALYRALSYPMKYNWDEAVYEKISEQGDTVVYKASVYELDKTYDCWYFKITLVSEKIDKIENWE